MAAAPYSQEPAGTTDGTSQMSDSSVHCDHEVKLLNSCCGFRKIGKKRRNIEDMIWDTDMGDILLEAYKLKAWGFKQISKCANRDRAVMIVAVLGIALPDDTNAFGCSGFGGK